MINHFFKQMMGYPLSEGKLDQKTATSLLRKSFPIVVRVEGIQGVGC
jgi:hypothetical protein